MDLLIDATRALLQSGAKMARHPNRAEIRHLIDTHQAQDAPDQTASPGSGEVLSSVSGWLRWKAGTTRVRVRRHQHASQLTVALSPLERLNPAGA